MVWVIVLQLVFQLYLAFLVGYLLLLAIVAWNASHERITQKAPPRFRFLVLIPAHNEERLLPELLASLENLDYPRSLYQVHVVADNCTDRTENVVQQSFARVHLRTDLQRLGKGYALNWLMDQLKQAGEPHDAIVFLDADSVVSPNFLQVMSAHLERGERAIQAYYAVRAPEQSWAGSLRYAALAVLHFLRPQGRMVLGASAGLKGNGMVFSADLMKHYSWSSSLTEDIELHMALLLNGERVTFAPEAVVWGEMPNKLSASVSQHTRWEEGRKQMAHTYVPKLLRSAWKELWAGRLRRAFLLFDAVMEFLQPPFSILAVASLGSLILSVALFGFVLPASAPTFWMNPRGLAALSMLLAVGLIFGQALYLLAGLRSVAAPRRVYLNLLNAPRLMLWKSWQMLMVLLGRGQGLWIRTDRNER
jgi:cellulose synthase/poly-beta-1,6-N-acetylglucosamine synthase-like glycosyltransferase